MTPAETPHRLSHPGAPDVHLSRAKSGMCVRVRIDTTASKHLLSATSLLVRGGARPALTLAAATPMMLRGTHAPQASAPDPTGRH